MLGLLVSATVLATSASVIVEMPVANAATRVTVLPNGGQLHAGDMLVSANRCFQAEMQTDGNFVLYRSQGHIAYWASNTDGHPGTWLGMQADGNVVLYSPSNAVVYGNRIPTGTNTHPGSNLELQDDGNLVVYAPGHVAVWATNTDGTPCGSTPGPRVVEIARAYATGQGSTIARRAENNNMFSRWYFNRPNDTAAHLNDWPWCAMFVSYAFNRAGVPLINGGKGGASTAQWNSGAVFANGKGAHFAFAPGATLRPGDVVYKTRVGGGHVGIVEWAAGNNIRVIEGNGSAADVVTGTTYTLSGRYWASVIRAPGF